MFHSSNPSVDLTQPQLMTCSMLFSVVLCRSPAPAARDSTWRGERCRPMRQCLSFLGLPVYFKFKILFYTFTKTLGQRFDIFSSPSPRFIISINHCCSSNRVPASVILSDFSRNQPYHLLTTSSNVTYVAARAQEGLEELSHAEGQEGQRWGDTPCPR